MPDKKANDRRLTGYAGRPTDGDDWLRNEDDKWPALWLPLAAIIMVVGIPVGGVVWLIW